ncbi:MAG TPA: hypothetical protein PLT76_10810 [Candidatus Omnitrophota bacterium]|nr:hypothetical protein [Candidatus Omnitrophota bacterium]HQO59190.1 hypothetical protein [Candidatus Omnitrophota bacterium]
MYKPGPGIRSNARNFIMRVMFAAIAYEQLGISMLSALAKQRGHDVQLAFSMALFNDRQNS